MADSFGGSCKMSSDLQQPYLNADLYRDFQTINKKYKNLEFIHVHSDGSSLVGASDLTGRTWDGMVQIASSARDFFTNSIEKDAISKTYHTNGVTDGVFLSDSTKMLICEDNGNLQCWSRGATWSTIVDSVQDSTWTMTSGICEHDDAILAIDLFSSYDSAITGGADNCIKIWDLFGMFATDSFRPAHTDIVSDVACHPNLWNLFLSSSLDGSVALWHLKNSDQKAKEFGSMSCAARCVCWMSDELFAVGYENGDIIIYSTCNTKESISVINFGHPLHKMAYNVDEKLLAVCGDANNLKVYQFYESSYLKVIYEDSRHTEYVKGLCWDAGDPFKFYSCGWDEQLLQHSVTKN